LRKSNTSNGGIKVSLTGEVMKYISLFEGFTQASALDCIIEDEDEAIFIVSPGESGKLRISSVRKLEQMIKRPVVTVEYSSDPSQFIKNSLLPARVLEVKLVEHADGRKTASVTVSAADKGKAIGKGGRVAQRTRSLAKRYFQVDNVHIL